MNKFAVIVLVLAFLAACAPPPPPPGPSLNVTGTWITGTSLADSAVYRLVQSGTSVSGNFMSSSSSCGNLGGSIVGNNLTFTIVLTASNCPSLRRTFAILPGSTARATFSGPVRGDIFQAVVTVTAEAPSGQTHTGEPFSLTLRRVGKFARLLKARDAEFQLSVSKKPLGGCPMRGDTLARQSVPSKPSSESRVVVFGGDPTCGLTYMLLGFRLRHER